MRWGAPGLLHLLWLLIPAGILLVFLLRRRRYLLAQLIEQGMTDQLVRGWSPRRTRTRNMIWLAAISLALLAFARPQWGYSLQEVKRRGMDILVLLDASKSMLAEDIKPNRLQQSKWGVADLVRRLKGDRIGLMAFSGSSFLQCPLTIDYSAFLMTLEDVDTHIIPRGGTAITQSLWRGMDAFDKNTTSDKAIILVTDGEDHEGNPLDLIDELKKKNIRVFAIGVGSLEGELIPHIDEEGHSGFLKNRQGLVIKSTLQESVLEQLALQTGGMYVRAAPGNFGLDRIYEQGLAPLQRDEQDARLVKAYGDRFTWFLLPAFLLFGIEAAYRDRRKEQPEE